jgi:hypothetical protein
MALTLATRIARSGLVPLREVLDREQTASPEELHELAEAVSLWSAYLDKLLEFTCQAADHGIESRKLAHLVKETMDAVGEGLAVYARARQALEVFPASEGRQEDLATLEMFRQRSEKMLENLRPLAHWLEAPPPSIDLSSLPAGEAVNGAGGENLDSILARLAAGGDL